MLGSIFLKQSLRRARPIKTVVVYAQRFMAKVDKCGFRKQVGPFANGTQHADADDLPIPKGDWYEDYSGKNKRYTMVLISGILAAVGSIYLLATKENLDMNFFVPAYPYPEEDEEEGGDGKEKLEKDAKGELKKEAKKEAKKET